MENKEKDFKKQMMELKFYRHKEYKDIYLAFNISKHEPYATKDMCEAIRYHKYIVEYLPRLMEMSIFQSEVMAWQLKKDFEIDGYKGTLVKTISIRCEDFEEVTLREVKK